MRQFTDKTAGRVVAKAGLAGLELELGATQRVSEFSTAGMGVSVGTQVNPPSDAKFATRRASTYLAHLLTLVAHADGKMPEADRNPHGTSQNTSTFACVAPTFVYRCIVTAAATAATFTAGPSTCHIACDGVCVADCSAVLLHCANL